MLTTRIEAKLEFITTHCTKVTPACDQERLKEAAKAQLRRMCAVKRKRVGMNCPEWVRQEWEKRDKGELASLLMSCNWSKALRLFVLFGRHWFLVRIMSCLSGKVPL